MRHLLLLTLLFALPCFATDLMPDVPLEKSACQLKHCDCPSFDLAELPDFGPSSQACACGHAPAVHGEVASVPSGSTHASGSSAFTTEREAMPINTVTAKMRCTTKKVTEPPAHEVGQYVYQDLELQAVYSPDPADPNYSYSKATPSASLRMFVTNPAAAEFFAQGGEYLLTFTRVDKAES